MMFRESAAFYDLVYRNKDYAGEAEKILEFRASTAITLLDVGCGTGEHHRYLSHHLTIHGLDINTVLLQTAQEKNPSVTYHLGDMRNIQLEGRYDMVTCLFGAIGYCQNLAELNSTVFGLAQRLVAGGILLIEPWVTPQAWECGRIYTDVHRTESLQLSRMSHSRREGQLSVMDFHYLVGQSGVGVDAFQEQHRMGLFTEEDIQTALADQGLQCHYDHNGLNGRGLHIGVMP